MDIELARHFAENWISAWNRHDLTAILSHYSDDIVFYSPFITLFGYNETGFINNKNDLKTYFETGLKKYPELIFELQDFYSGINTILISYISVNGRKAAELFEVNEDGIAVKVYCNYAESL